MSNFLHVYSVLSQSFRFFLSGPCGGNLTSDKHGGVIISPNYPKPYPSGLICEWHIHPSEPGHTLMLHFADFEIEGSPRSECWALFGKKWDLFRCATRPASKRGFGLDFCQNGMTFTAGRLPIHTHPSLGTESRETEGDTPNGGCSKKSAEFSGISCVHLKACSLPSALKTISMKAKFFTSL